MYTFLTQVAPAVSLLVLPLLINNQQVRASPISTGPDVAEGSPHSKYDQLREASMKRAQAVNFANGVSMYPSKGTTKRAINREEVIHVSMPEKREAAPMADGETNVKTPSCRMFPRSVTVIV